MSRCLSPQTTWCWSDVFRPITQRSWKHSVRGWEVESAGISQHKGLHGEKCSVQAAQLNCVVWFDSLNSKSSHQMSMPRCMITTVNERTVMKRWISGLNKSWSTSVILTLGENCFVDSVWWCACSASPTATPRSTLSSTATPRSKHLYNRWMDKVDAVAPINFTGHVCEFPLKFLSSDLKDKRLLPDKFTSERMVPVMTFTWPVIEWVMKKTQTCFLKQFSLATRVNLSHAQWIQ